MYRDHDVTAKCCCNTLCFTRHTCRAPHIATAAAALVGFLYSKHNKHRVTQSDDTVKPSLCSSAGSIKRTVTPRNSPCYKLSLQQAATETGGGDKRTWNWHLSHQDRPIRLFFCQLKLDDNSFRAYFDAKNTRSAWLNWFALINMQQSKL